MHDKYNIVTVSNETYKIFLEIFVKSLLKHIPSDRLHKIHIYDTGLADQTKSFFENISTMLTIHPTRIAEQSVHLHDRGWEASTYFKTKALLQTLDTNPYPSILIDCDTIFLDNIFPVIEKNRDYEIGVCRTNQSTWTKYLGSFFIARDVEKSKNFVRMWADEINNISSNAKESPALVNIVENHSVNFKIYEFMESQVSSLYPCHEAVIYHLKSGGPLRTIEDRLGQNHVQSLIADYWEKTKKHI